MAEKRARTSKTPRQRVQERVAVLERAHTRLMGKRETAMKAVTDLDTQIAEVEEELAHERAHPAMQNLLDGDGPIDAA